MYAKTNTMTTIEKFTLLKCIIDPLNGDCKKGHYYLGYPYPFNPAGQWIICGHKDTDGWPLVLGGHNFINVR